MLAEFSPFQAIAGGMLIGLASVLLMWGIGRIAGISGIAIGVFKGSASDRAWRLSFLMGLVVAPLVFGFVSGTEVAITISEKFPALIVGGLLVGLGASIGGGCTSGHGVCGIGRLSARSIIAVTVFMITAFTVHPLLRLGLGVLP